MQEKLSVKIGADITGFKSGLKSATDFTVSSAKKIIFAFTGVITASALVGEKFHKELINTATVAQAFGKDLEALEKKARSIGKTTAFTAAQAAKGMYDLASAGLKTQEIIDATEASMLLAGATAAEMSQATHLVASSIRQFNMDTKESRRITDTFAAAITNSLLTMDKLTEAMKYAGTTGAAFKWDIEQTTAAVAMFTNLGLEGSMAGTNLRMSMLTLSSQTKNVTDTLEELGLTFEDVNPETHTFGEILRIIGLKSISSRQAVELFGARAGLNMKSLSEQAVSGAINYEKFVNKLRESQEGIGRTAEMYDRMMDTFGGQWKVLWSAIQELGITVFDLYKEEGKKIFTYLANEVNKFAELIKNNANDIKSGIFTMAEVAAGAFKVIVNGVAWALKGLLSMKGVILTIKGAFNEILAKNIESNLPNLKKQMDIYQAEITKRSSAPYAGTLVNQWTGEETKILGGPTSTAFGARKEQKMQANELVTAFTKIRLEYEENKKALEAINKAAMDTNESWEDMVNDLISVDNSMLPVNQKLDAFIEKLKLASKQIKETGIATIFDVKKEKEFSWIDTEEGKVAQERVDEAYRRYQEVINESARKYSKRPEEPVHEEILKAQQRGREDQIKNTARLYEAMAEQIKEQSRLQNEFYTEYRTLGKSEYELRIEQINNQAQVWRDAKIDEVKIAEWAEKRISEIKREETNNRLQILEGEFGKVAQTAKNILDMTKGQSRGSWKIYKVFAIAEATISGIRSVMNAYAEGVKINPAVGYAMAGIAAAFTATQIAAIKAAEPPSYDKGGISTKPGVYYSGVPEAHIPLKGGKVPVSINSDVAGGGVTILLRNPVFQDSATLRRSMKIIAEETTMRLAPAAINMNYHNDGSIRKMIRGRT